MSLVVGHSGQNHGHDGLTANDLVQPDQNAMRVRGIDHNLPEFAAGGTGVGEAGDIIIKRKDNLALPVPRSAFDADVATKRQLEIEIADMAVSLARGGALQSEAFTAVGNVVEFDARGIE